MSHVHHRPLLAGLAIAAAVCLAACTTTGSDNPTTGPQTTATTTSASAGGLPGDGAPKVPNPVSIDKYKSQPCSALTSTQLHTLGITASGAPDMQDPARPTCNWPNADGPAVSIAFSDGGLTGTYQRHNAGYTKLLKRVPDLNGFPAVLTAVGETSIKGGCQYAIGFSDNAVAGVIINSDPAADPCDDVKQIALAVTTTVKTGG